ncbi:ferritin-like domain-containing protein, partial [Bacteriovoracaceae bacterium]|nr:ferritin-like domain-containing protein [Bacteriovoracaceae bacterium]
FDPSEKEESLSVDFFKRDSSIEFSKKKIKFPNINKILQDKYARAFAIASFANHELQAIECMAYAIKYFWNGKDEEKNYIRGLVAAIVDEQKHFKLYQKIIKDLGYDFAEFPKNDFFLRHLLPLKNLSQFAAMMNLTFESANIDFALYYQKIFSQNKFFDIADCLEVVLKDEIGHVSLGKIQLGSKSGSSSELWAKYIENLVFPLSPARARGIDFKPENRKAIGLGEEFIQNLANYSDNYSITKRKK